MIQQEFSNITQELLVLLYILLTWIINGRMTVDSYEVVSDSQSTRLPFGFAYPGCLLDSKGTQHPGGGGTPLKEANSRMCRLMGSHFHD